ncbi:hypothetical protein AAVH_14116 [Aphelenchoides avenae]|nr:hypothetical protein AAVH_14116 [Aphelenchus avenae]
MEMGHPCYRATIASTARSGLPRHSACTCSGSSSYRTPSHPYDLRLWQADQSTTERGATLPAWTNRHQTEEGNVHRFGAIETRKSNMRAYDAPPPELNSYYTLPIIRPRGQALAAQLAAAGNKATDGAAAAHPAADAVVVRNPQLGAATAHSAVNATQTGPSSTVQQPNTQPTPAVPSPAQPASSQPSLTMDTTTALVTQLIDRSILQVLVDQATQQAVAQVTATLDTKLEALLRQPAHQDSQPTTSANHRPQDRGSDA